MRNDRRFGNRRENFAARKRIAGLYDKRGFPFFIRVKRGKACAASDKRAEFLLHVAKRTFDAVEDVAHDTRPQRHAER